MAEDLVARLRAVTANSLICREAADEIERTKDRDEWREQVFRMTETITEWRHKCEGLAARETELLAQIESMRSGLDDALDKVRRRL